MYGIGFVALVLIIGVLKADTQTRVILALFAIAAALFFRTHHNKRR